MNCPHCGILIEEKWEFCPRCSNVLKEGIKPLQQQEIQYTTLTSDKSQQTAITFCGVGLALVIVGLMTHFYLLALIGGGMHRFYVGKMFSGALYSITCGMFGIGLIFDLIQLRTGQFSDNVGQPLRR